MRLDKLLANLKYGTRTEIKKIIKDKNVLVNNKVVKDGSIHVNPNKDVISIYDEIIEYKEYIYMMMNKPSGYISATIDNMHKTVIDLLSDSERVYDVFPCGRLDIDTEGLIILANDGKFAHRLLHPKKEIYKKYYVEVDKDLEPEDIIAFKNGLEIYDGNNELYKTKKALLEIIAKDKAYVYICEGKFHQVKRMFQKVGKQVIYLKRISIGKLALDDSLLPGKYKELNEDEIKLLFKNEYKLEGI